MRTLAALFALTASFLSLSLAGPALAGPMEDAVAAYRQADYETALPDDDERDDGATVEPEVAWAARAV